MLFSDYRIVISNNPENNYQELRDFAKYFPLAMHCLNYSLQDVPYYALAAIQGRRMLLYSPKNVNRKDFTFTVNMVETAITKKIMEKRDKAVSKKYGV